jgi:hypothetical protein
MGVTDLRVALDWGGGARKAIFRGKRGALWADRSVQMHSNFEEALDEHSESTEQDADGITPPGSF